MSCSDHQAVEVVLRVHDSQTLMGVGCVGIHAVHANLNVRLTSLNGEPDNVPLLHQELLWSPGWLPSWLCVLNVHTILLVSRSNSSGSQTAVLVSSTC